MKGFKLSGPFLSEYEGKQPKWGFGELGRITYLRTYSREKEDGTNEEFWETCKRVVEGVYAIQKDHCSEHRLPWDNVKAQKSAQEMYARMWEFKWLPPGRGLWMMGAPIVDKIGSAALNSCGMISTKHISVDFAEPFCWAMDMLMLGVGVGFDTKGAGIVTIQEPRQGDDTHVVDDSREGWVEILNRTVTAYSGKGSLPKKVDYSQLREKGAPVKGFGGVSSGPQPLVDMVKDINKTLKKLIGKDITVTAIVDIFNFIGRCVVSGGIRRSSEIAFGDIGDTNFLNLKNPKRHKKELESFRWVSNESVFAEIGDDYAQAAEFTMLNGEPGYMWLENARKYGRLKDPADWADRKVVGSNPCFVGSTKIAVADGRGVVTLEELAEEGSDVPVYSLDPGTGEVSIKWGRCPRKTQEDASLVRVHLENGGYVDCTPDHKWYLRDNTWKRAKDLASGDSLAKFVKLQEVMKTGGKRYWQVFTLGYDTKKGKVFEHKLIANFFDPETYTEMYDEAKQSGWCKGGLVVHHKNYDPLDNTPDNLEWMTFRDHAKFHGDRDQSGEKNGMWGRKHSEETKDKIRQKTIERCKDPAYRKKLSEAQKSEENVKASSDRLKKNKAKWDMKYYLEQEKTTDLDTLWIDNKLHSSKFCEICSEDFIVPWSKRNRSFCSLVCGATYRSHLESRMINQRQFFDNKQKSTRHAQVMVVKDLQQELGRDPWKKEWEAECRDRGIPFRFKSKGAYANNPYVFEGFRQLKAVASEYNDRVKSVETLSYTEDVYCMTVDDNHTMVVVPEGKDLSKSIRGLHVSNCGEISLESGGMCCLVETFPSRHDSLEDYLKTLKYAYLYAKSVTIVPTHSAKTNMVVQKNRRIGTSMSGITQAINKLGYREFMNWCDKGYEHIRELDQEYSDWLCIRTSKKLTTTKPSGSVSLLTGATPGIHYPHSEFYIRRVRFQDTSPLVATLESHGYHVEPDTYSTNTVVVEFPVQEENFTRAKADVSMWEQLMLAADMQYYWADNQVSVTVTFKPEEAKDIKLALEKFETKLKGVSFLPLDGGGYKQAPYEEITQEQYKDMMKRIKPIKSLTNADHEVDELYCDGDVCTVK